MNRWIPLDNPDQLHLLIEESHSQPHIIFKHSTRCGLSAIAKLRIESEWHHFEQIPFYLLNVIDHRSLSQQVAEQLDVYHESPQLLLIQAQECVFESSHLDIQLSEISDVIIDQ